jgi:hypothetical protein
MAVHVPTDQNEISGILRQINNDIRHALADESTSVRVQELLDLYRTTEAGLRTSPSPLVAAAVRFRDACATSARRVAEQTDLTSAETIEMQEATLRLIYVTNTTTIEGALDALHDFEA